MTFRDYCINTGWEPFEALLNPRYKREKDRLVALWQAFEAGIQPSQCPQQSITAN